MASQFATSQACEDSFFILLLLSELARRAYFNYEIDTCGDNDDDDDAFSLSSSSADLGLLLL